MEIGTTVNMSMDVEYFVWQPSWKFIRRLLIELVKGPILVHPFFTASLIFHAVNALMTGRPYYC
jgi:hypothetical protein